MDRVDLRLGVVPHTLGEKERSLRVKCSRSIWAMSRPGFFIVNRT